MAHGSPPGGPRVQEVDRYGVHVQRGERQPQLDALRPAFTQAEDAAAAGFKPGGLGGAHSGQVLLVGVGGADLTEVAGGGFEVVMIAAQARSLEARGLLGVQQTERGADAEAGRLFEQADGLANQFEFGCG